MKQGNAIEVNNVTKKFKVYYDKGRQLKEKLLFKNRNRYEERHVLKGISFEVKKGEAIGLIGKNGCGKSTTLKLLTKIIYPDSGSIEMSGRVSSLIELGAGFHQDMSGRENIYTNAAIFGLGKKEIDEKLDDIIEFSELGEFIDNPVRTYSSGMYMRLAFSVAINVEADVLLIDEILAVGDAAFQAKCFNRLREIKAMGTTIVIVSHSLGQIEQICDRAIWIKDGNVEMDGEPRSVIQLYMSWIMDDSKKKKTNVIKENVAPSKDVKKSEEKEEKYEYTPQDILNLRKNGKYAEIGNKDVVITNYELLCPTTGKRKLRFCVGEDILCRVFYKRLRKSLSEAMFSLAIYRADGMLCYTTNSLIDTGENLFLQDEGVLEFLIKVCPLLQGEYRMDFGLNMDYGPTYHCILNACCFEMYNIATDYGICKPQIIWNIKKQEEKPMIDISNINLKNYASKLAINNFLNINKENYESLNELLDREYDLIVIEDVFETLELKKQVIKQVLENTEWLMVYNSKNFNFESKIDDCIILKDEEKKNSLIKISTKNRKIVLDILNDIKDRRKNKWLLDSFKQGEILIKIGGKEKQEGKTILKVGLYNTTDSIIDLLDDGIFISYKREAKNEIVEGPWIEIQKTLYCGNNMYLVPVEENGKVNISVLKDGEYWIDDILPEAVKCIEV